MTNVMIIVLGSIMLAGWLIGMQSWLKKGIRFPKYIHTIALIFSSIGIGCLIGLAIAGLAGIKLSLMLVLLPPVLTYFGWLWMHGPELREV